MSTLVRKDRRGQRRAAACAHACAERRHKVFVSWNVELLTVLACGSGVKVVHRASDHRLAGQHECGAHLSAAVACVLRLGRCPKAARLGEYSGPVARASGSKAADSLRLAQRCVEARDAALRARARADHRHAQLHLVVACEVDLGEPAGAQRVERGVVGSVARAIGHHEVKVPRGAVRQVERAYIDEPNLWRGVGVGALPSEVAVEQVCGREVKAHALADARVQRRRRR